MTYTWQYHMNSVYDLLEHSRRAYPIIQQCENERKNTQDIMILHVASEDQTSTLTKNTRHYVVFNITNNFTYATDLTSVETVCYSF